MSFHPCTFNITVLIDFKALSKSTESSRRQCTHTFSHVIKRPEAVKHKRIQQIASQRQFDAALRT
jgi:hypothetical protein